MAKNRLEQAFRSAPKPPPENGGGEGGSQEGMQMMAACIPANYFSTEQERARWDIIHQYDKEGRVQEVWNHPFFQVMDMESIQRNFPITKPPAHADHMTALMLESHYREIVRRVMEHPEDMDTCYPESTVAEMFGFLVEGIAVAHGANPGDLDKEGKLLYALVLYRCMERIYGEKDAYLFYRVQLSGYYRELEMEGRVHHEDDTVKVTQQIPAMRKTWKFVQDCFDPSDMSNLQRTAADNLLDELKTSLLNHRSKFRLMEHGPDECMERAIETTLRAAIIFAKKKNWKDWLNKEGA